MPVTPDFQPFVVERIHEIRSRREELPSIEEYKQKKTKARAKKTKTSTSEKKKSKRKIDAQLKHKLSQLDPETRKILEAQLT